MNECRCINPLALVQPGRFENCAKDNDRAKQVCGEHVGQRAPTRCQRSGLDTAQADLPLSFHLSRCIPTFASKYSFDWWRSLPRQAEAPSHHWTTAIGRSVQDQSQQCPVGIASRRAGRSHSTSEPYVDTLLPMDGLAHPRPYIEGAHMPTSDCIPEKLAQMLTLMRQVVWTHLLAAAGELLPRSTSPTMT